MDPTEGPVLLVKAAAMRPRIRLALGAERPEFRTEKLFHSIAPPAPAGAAAMAGAAAQWHVLRAPPAAAAQSAWDMCHALLTGGLGFDGAPTADFAEPDMAQRWPFADEVREAMKLAGGCPTEGQRQDERFPRDPNALWYRDATHGQFADALGSFNPATGGAVRIAHLDTGYDPTHKNRPAHIRHDLERNFVDPAHPNDAADRTDALLANSGHGTGTLGILAGQGIGAAPFAEVVPIRVADRVVLFWNSNIARAFDHVHGLGADPGSFVHVVTMSMGGVASHAWADAVNALYELGVVVVTAAGNNFGNMPTRHIVYPARFGRVLAACGVMADGTPYADLGLGRMAGNYGPPKKMTTALAAYTPNTPWPRLGCADIFDSNGAGTSSATPQVAAAAALYIARHRTALAAYP